MGIFSRASSRVEAPDSNITALTASAQVVTNLGREDEWFRRVLQPWQQEAFAFYRTCGEAQEAAQFYARPLSKIRLFAAEIDEQGEVKECPSDSVPAQAWARVHDRGSNGRSQLQANYGRLFFLAGEGYLVATETASGEAWEFLSSNEWRINAGSGAGYSRYRAPGMNPLEYVKIPEGAEKPTGNQAWVARIWRPDPIQGWLADAPMRAVLGLFAELELLTLAVAAQTKSRIAQAGILYVANELSFGSANAQQNDDPTKDPFMNALTKAMTSAISTPGSAAAVVPVIVRGPSEHGEKGLKWIQIGKPMEKYPEVELRRECIARIATGLDMPPEQLLGKEDANHWTSWNIDENTWSTNLQPVAEGMARDFAHAYLRQACKAASYANWENVVLGVDAAEVINHPDRFKDALELHDRGGLGIEKLMDVGGFDYKTDKMSPQEYDTWLALQLKDKTQLDAEEAVDGEDPGAVVKAPPETENQTDEDAEESAVTASIIGASELAVERIRELVGSRLRGPAQHCEDCLPLIDGIPNALVASALGKDRSLSMVPVTKLMADGTEGLRKVLTDRYEIEGKAADKICGLVASHAGRWLFSETAPALPDSFSAYLKRVM